MAAAVARCCRCVLANPYSVTGATERPNALRKGALNARPDGILGLPVRGRLTLTRGQQRFMFGARLQREFPRLILGVGA